MSAATGALLSVLGKLPTLLVEECKRLKGVRGDIKFLMDELTAMQAFLLRMSEEEDPGVQDKAWMTAVRELSYDMEDSIDDFMQTVDHKEAKQDGLVAKIKHSLGKLGKLKKRHRSGIEIQDLKKQTIEVGERNARYKARDAFSKTINATVDPRALVIFENASKLVGIDEPKNYIIKLLTEEEDAKRAQTKQNNKTEDEWESTHPLILVSITGSGGIGKTTLANQVYGHLKKRFKFRAFVSVSRNPNIMDILRIVLSQVTGQRYADTEAGSLQLLITKITDFLAYKRYFIVLDDIWDVKTWDIIKCAFPVANFGSKIITTTRINDVAKSCHASFGGHIYNMRPLNIMHSRKLFNERLFNLEEGCPPYLEDISEQILKKCDGLPLAIIAIAGLLANTERSESVWSEVKDSIGRALERNPSVEAMMKIISLSYFDLPPHLKTCLLYLSIFPEDCIIGKKGLIRRWIAERFIHKQGRYTLYELGEMCFNELVNRSLLQPVETNKHGKVKSFRVHDTILDFIVSKSIEENFVTIDGVQDPTIGTKSKVRRLSLQGGKQQIDSTLLTRHAFSNVRSLSVFGNHSEVPSLDGFTRLHVLDFGDCKQLENRHLAKIGRLFRLRYLNLRNTNVSELPEEIMHLGCLEMLDLRGTLISEFPVILVNLVKLEVLLVDVGVNFPDGTAKMQALQLLKWVGIGAEQALSFLCEPGQLQKLRKVYLEMEGVGQEDLCILGGLPALLILILKVTAKAKDRLRVSGGVGFRCLIELRYHRVELGGMDLMFAPGSMPKLEKLDIAFNAGESDSLSSEAFGIGNLPSLISIKCEVRGWLSSTVAAAKDYLETTARTHPNRPTLLLA